MWNDRPLASQLLDEQGKTLHAMEDGPAGMATVAL
jgi:hypothetical protein